MRREMFSLLAAWTEFTGTTAFYSSSLLANIYDEKEMKACCTVHVA